MNQMQTISIESLVTLLTPVCSGLFCLLLLSIQLPVWDKLKGTGMRSALSEYYAMIVLNWGMLILLTLYPKQFIYVRVIMILCGMLVPAMLYRVLFLLTRTDPREKFSAWNWVVPAVFILLHVIWSVCVPREVFAKTSFYLTQSVPGYKGLYILVMLVAPLRALLGIAYLVLSILRYRRYRRYMADYSSELQRNSIHWVKVFLVLWLSGLLIPIPAMAFPVKVLIGQLKLMLPALLLFMQHVLLVFNVIRRNYVVVQETASTQDNDKISCEKKLREPDFEKYLQRCKPCLDPDLTIVDMARAIGVNRSYLSAFINSTYGMNFSQLINECRLRELDRIIANPPSACQTNSEKIAMAGFGSYQSYRRAIKMQEKRILLSSDE